MRGFKGLKLREDNERRGKGEKKRRRRFVTWGISIGIATQFSLIRSIKMKNVVQLRTSKGVLAGCLKSWVFFMGRIGY